VEKWRRGEEEGEELKVGVAAEAEAEAKVGAEEKEKVAFKVANFAK